MRLIIGLLIAAAAASLLLGCGSTEEVSQPQSLSTTPPTTSTPTATDTPTSTPTPAPSATPVASYEWIPPTPEVPREDLGAFWFVPAQEEDADKPKITQQIVNGIEIGPDANLLPELTGCIGPATRVSGKDVHTLVPGSLADVDPSYLPPGVQLEMTDAAECQGVAVTVAKRYSVENIPDPDGTGVPLWTGGGFTITRRLTDQKRAFISGVQERLYAATLAGYPSVVVEPLTPLGYDIGLGSARIVVSDGQTITSVEGNGLPFSELLMITESMFGG